MPEKPKCELEKPKCEPNSEISSVAKKPKSEKGSVAKKPKSEKSSDAEKPKSSSVAEKPKSEKGPVARKPKSGSDAGKPKSGSVARKPKSGSDAEKPKSGSVAEEPKSGSDAEQLSSEITTSLEVISSDKHQATCSGARISHQDSVSLDMNKFSSIPFAERVRLRNAAVKGDWKEAKHILEKHPNAVRVTAQGLTVLHIAAFSKHNAFAKKVMKWMTPEDLRRLRHDAEATAFSHAVLSGSVHCVKMMMKKAEKLPLPVIRDKNGRLPIYWAVFSGRRKMVSYLMSLTPCEDLTREDRIELFLWQSLGTFMVYSPSH